MVEWIAAGGLALNVIVAIVGMTWGMSKIKDTIRSEMDNHIEKLQIDIDNTARSFGETILAIREKIREVELFNRDTFVRRESFSEVTNRISSEIKELSRIIEVRLMRMEGKIDKHDLP